jgi:hypothetical protein
MSMRKHLGQTRNWRAYARANGAGEGSSICCCPRIRGFVFRKLHWTGLRCAGMEFGIGYGRRETSPVPYRFAYEWKY